MTVNKTLSKFENAFEDPVDPVRNALFLECLRRRRVVAPRRVFAPSRSRLVVRRALGMELHAREFLYLKQFFLDLTKIERI